MELEKKLELTKEEAKKLDTYIRAVVRNYKGEVIEVFRVKNAKDLQKWISIVYGDFIEEDSITAMKMKVDHETNIAKPVKCVRAY